MVSTVARWRAGLTYPTCEGKLIYVGGIVPPGRVTMTTSLPTASVVSRALRRDVKIITRPQNEYGYSVHRGGGTLGPSIWVSVSDSDATNQRHARELAENLHEVFGWNTILAPGSSILYVKSVPSKAEALEAEARYDAKDKAETERRIELATAGDAANRDRIPGVESPMPKAIAANLGFLGGGR